MKVLIVANREKPHMHDFIQEVEDFLTQEGVESLLHFSDENKSLTDEVDLAISLGGDGTVLYTARHLHHPIPVFSINLGTVGFITEFSQEYWKEGLLDFFRGKSLFSQRLMLAVTLKRGEKALFSSALNDVVVSSDRISKLISLDFSIDGTDVGSYRSDGVLCATPTGSTAYSAAAGGPILDPEMEAMIINPICPYSLSNRPLVIPVGKKVTFRPALENKTSLIYTLDGQEAYPFLPEDQLELSIHKNKLLLVKDSQRHFYDVLRSKLMWWGGSHG